MRSSYEDLAVGHAAAEGLPILEAYDPVGVGRWFDTMAFRLQKLIKKYEDTNPEYADNLRKYWVMWQSKGQEIRDMSPEAFDYLSAGAATNTTMDWPEQSFFQGLTVTLNSVSNDIRRSPTGAGNAAANEPFTGGAGASTPPLGTDFGPEEEEPPLGAPGEEEAPPEGEEPGAAPAPAPGPGAAPEEPEKPTAL